MFVFYDENLKGTYSEPCLSDCSQLWEEMGANIVFFMVLFLFLLSDTTTGAWHEREFCFCQSMECKPFSAAPCYGQLNITNKQP